MAIIKNHEQWLRKKKTGIKIRWSCAKQATDLHSEGEVAAFGVPDDAGVHGRLSSPAPL